MDFVDVASNSDNTADELYALTGKLPAMIGRGPLISDVSRYNISDAADSTYGLDADPATVSSVYINSNAVDAVSILKAVPTDIDPPLVRLVSKDIATSDDETASGDRGIIGVAEIVYESADIPLQPVSIRMRIPRSNSLIVNHWDELDNAANSRELFNIFSRYGTVWVRAENTGEKDANLFTAINNKGNDLGVTAGDCVRAFLYDDALYLDFIVIMADGSSVRPVTGTLDQLVLIHRVLTSGVLVTSVQLV